MSDIANSSILRAGLFMVLAMGSFVTNDTMVKLIGPSLPVGEIIMIRGIMATLLIAMIAASQGVLGSVPQLRSGTVVTRAMLDLFATILFITALMHMQIANLTAILQAVPLAVAFLSATFLGEKVGWRRSTAIILGFIGVLLIVKPTPANFSVFDIVALVIVFAVAVRDIVTRRIPSRVPTLIIALANATFVTAGGAVLCFFEDFTWPQAWQLGLLALASIFLASGYMFMVATLRAGDLSATAPFRYSIMIFAIISGIAVFGEMPDTVAMVGMVLIVATGLYAAHREARLKNISRTPAP
ncbi:MAG: DMT family transporter [Notoacmeibacter sp.]|nr:DMT family transporter [Alphaproteobacteria bacterium]MCB1426266.1 DMT family transporter [Notoacmeibacter sp.]